mmetsp:Transcript_16146/g.29098  ORF Transcript_16146/g.29098 Transcript_16146/m.29098 type:complete len:160 (-) Transcript_16146:92-571(-)|eukprot:CAMPEP_0196146322 /NCGR_PEP_ID=MMETSP0910-20130528/22737_1 /TAXON_ID=49265 /ORGANISM="Thalassiosira rotula, Strain GSO102" /LENGTH=159 /DNA_ID=CAMNT_0041408493 /DNA_START=12 /DNA_END=491 /DNA_ORIENTATION=-
MKATVTTTTKSIKKSQSKIILVPTQWQTPLRMKQFPMKNGVGLDVEAVPLQCHQDDYLTKSKIIIVQTQRQKPLRMKQFPKKKSVAGHVQDATTPMQCDEDSPFLYYSLSTNTIDGRSYAIENANDDDSDVVKKAYYPVEVDPLYDIMSGIFGYDPHRS